MPVVKFEIKCEKVTDDEGKLTLFGTPRDEIYMLIAARNRKGRSAARRFPGKDDYWGFKSKDPDSGDGIDAGKLTRTIEVMSPEIPDGESVEYLVSVLEQDPDTATGDLLTAAAQVLGNIKHLIKDVGWLASAARVVEAVNPLIATHLNNPHDLVASFGLKLTMVDGRVREEIEPVAHCSRDPEGRLIWNGSGARYLARPLIA